MGRRKIPPPPTIPKISEICVIKEKELLVGTIFAKDSPSQRSWLDIQLKFLRATTQDFDHITILYSNIESDYFNKNSEVIRLNSGITDSRAHVTGLNLLSDIFRSRRNVYRNFLFLDSDAFPIRNDWQSVLSSKMTQHDIAIPLRTENLETRLHSSILYAKREALNGLEFKISQVGNDLIGYPEADVLVNPYQNKCGNVFTLVRSNKNNIHPVLCGVYYDCFYHHCCGSGRMYNLRSRDYWDTFFEKDVDVGSFTKELFDNPTDFVKHLAGWSPINYPNF